jgi:hypothetical protein
VVQGLIYDRIKKERREGVSKEKILPSYRAKNCDFFFIHRQDGEPVFMQMLNLDSIADESNAVSIPRLEAIFAFNDNPILTISSQFEFKISGKHERRYIKQFDLAKGWQ